MTLFKCVIMICLLPVIAFYQVQCTGIDIIVEQMVNVPKSCNKEYGFENQDSDDDGDEDDVNDTSSDDSAITTTQAITTTTGSNCPTYATEITDFGCIAKIDSFNYQMYSLQCMALDGQALIDLTSLDQITDLLEVFDDGPYFIGLRGYDWSVNSLSVASDSDLWSPGLTINPDFCGVIGVANSPGISQVNCDTVQRGLCMVAGMIN